MITLECDASKISQINECIGWKMNGFITDNEVCDIDDSSRSQGHSF